uniref:hypothetical protein n=1 Tax=Catenulispora rubra TaxID=280293 RepID=UPI001E2C4A8C
MKRSLPGAATAAPAVPAQAGAVSGTVSGVVSGMMDEGVAAVAVAEGGSLVAAAPASASVSA